MESISGCFPTMPKRRLSSRRLLRASSSLTATPLSAPVVVRHDVFEALPPPVPAGQSSGWIPRVGPFRLRLPLLLVFTNLAAALPP